MSEKYIFMMLISNNSCKRFPCTLVYATICCPDCLLVFVRQKQPAVCTDGIGDNADIVRQEPSGSLSENAKITFLKLLLCE